MGKIDYFVFAPQDFARQFDVNPGEAYIQTVKMDRSIIHFSGGNGGDYVRKGSEQF